MLLREIAGCHPQPSAAIEDRRTMQSSLEGGAQASCDGDERRKG